MPQVCQLETCDLLTPGDEVRSRWCVGEFCYCSILALKETMLIKIFCGGFATLMFNSYICFFFQGEDIMDEEYGINL